MVDAGGFVRGKRDGREGFESDRLFGWFKDERCPHDDVKAATETSVAGVGALVVRRAEKLAGRRGDDFARNQLHARKQEDDYRGDPKDRDSRRHTLPLIFAQSGRDSFNIFQGQYPDGRLYDRNGEVA